MFVGVTNTPLGNMAWGHRYSQHLCLVLHHATCALEVLRTSPPLASLVGTPLLCKGV